MNRSSSISSLLLALVLSGCEQESANHTTSLADDDVVVIAEAITIDRAIARGDLSTIKALLESDPSVVNQGRRPDMPPLLNAILRQKVEIAQLLISNGADVNVTDPSSRTSVHLAVERNLPELIPLLAKNGAKLNTLDNVGWAPLHWAAAKDRMEVTSLLIDVGADVHATSQLGGSVLHEAASSGSAEMIQLLIDAGVDPNVIANDGGRAFDVALKYENTDAIQLLEPITQPID